MRQAVIDSRCSRPLCSSQTTTRHHPATTPPDPAPSNTLVRAVWNPERPGQRKKPHPPTPREPKLSPDRGVGPFPQDPTARLRPPASPTPLHTPPHPPKRKRQCRTGGRPTTGGRTGQRSTLEHHPTHTPTTHSGRCDPGAGAALHRQAKPAGEVAP